MIVIPCNTTLCTSERTKTRYPQDAGIPASGPPTLCRQTPALPSPPLRFPSLPLPCPRAAHLSLHVSLHAGNHLIQIQRLHHVVRRARLQRRHRAHGPAAAAQYQHRHRGVQRLQRLDELRGRESVEGISW